MESSAKRQCRTGVFRFSVLDIAQIILHGALQISLERRIRPVRRTFEIHDVHYATAFHSLIRSEHWRLVRSWTSVTLHLAAICCGVQPRLRPKSSRYLICLGLAATSFWEWLFSGRLTVWLLVTGCAAGSGSCLAGLPWSSVSTLSLTSAKVSWMRF